MRNTDNIPTDLIASFWCTECNDECSIMEQNYATKRRDGFDYPFCNECNNSLSNKDIVEIIEEHKERTA